MREQTERKRKEIYEQLSQNQALIQLQDKASQMLQLLKVPVQSQEECDALLSVLTPSLLNEIC